MQLQKLLRFVQATIVSTSLLWTSVTPAGLELVQVAPPTPIASPNLGDYTSPSSSTLSKNCGGGKMNPSASDYKECGECESSLQDGFNAIVDDLMVGDYRQPSGGHWSDATLSGDRSIRSGASVEGALEKITKMMRDQNGGKLNYMVIGNSHSLHGTRPGYPRIAIKSPNSELIVTYNTDPNDKAYNTIEVQRWNGKLGKFEYTELDFGSADIPARGDLPAIPARPSHVENNPTKCMECHKGPSPRPNWGTYRAWAEVLPPRDDMIEIEPRSSLGYNPTATGARIDSFGNAYLSFLGDVSRARAQRNATGRPNRLGLLDIPYDSIQLGSEPSDDNDKISRIRDRVRSEGFYRVPHVPLKASLLMNGNVDSKTAEYAGSSHLAFDQMQGMNMCRVATDLKRNPDFNKFKFAITAILKCNVNTFAGLRNYMPDWALDQARAFFQEPNNRRAHPPGTTTAIAAPAGNQEVFDAIVANTANSHSKADEYKRQSAIEFLRNDLYRQNCNASYWTCPSATSPQYRNVRVHGEDSFHNCVCRYEALNGTVTMGAAYKNPARQAEIDAEATRLSSTTMAPAISAPLEYHAIGDPGGVNGVAENATNDISAARFLLDPFNVNVGHWSMVQGKDATDNSYSFSDQFVLLKNEKVFEMVMRQTPGSNDAQKCNNLPALSRAAFGTGPRPASVEAAPPEENDLQRLCGTVLSDSLPNIPDSVSAATLTAVRDEMRTLARRIGYPKNCGGCHSASAGIAPNFPGAENENFNSFGTFLTQGNLESGQSNYEALMKAVSPTHFNQLTGVDGQPLSSPMPPGGFSAPPASGISRDEARRIFEMYITAEYVSQSNNSTNQARLRSLCRGIINSRPGAPSVGEGNGGDSVGGPAASPK